MSDSPSFANEQDAIAVEQDMSGSRDPRCDGVAEVPYPELAQDIEGTDWLASLDRWLDRAASWFNPILIKEARQSLKSRQFILTFFLLLTASAIWTLVGVVLNAPDVYYVPTGESLLWGYYFILAIPLIGLVPLAAYRSLAAEIDDDTFEMLVITRLSSMRIVLGKMNSAMLQMLIYFAAIVPCLAFSYLLRGISLPTILLLILTVFVTAILLTSFALMLATLAPNRFGQTMVLLSLIMVVLFAEFMCASFCLAGIMSYNMGQDWDLILGVAFYTLISASFIVLFVKAAAARVASVTENRSTGLRWCMFAQQLLWIGAMAAFSDWAEESDVLNFANVVLGGYWLTMGTLMLAESPELSPRVQRGLPSTFFGRSLLTWFNPGPGTGYVFAIASGSVGAISLGMIGSMFEFSWQAKTDTPVFAALIVGYLLGYLGAIRLIAMPLSRRMGNGLAIPIACCAAVLLTAALLPTVLMVLTTGAPSYSYTPLEAIDWVWSLSEAFDRSFDPALALLVLIGGILITVVNLALLFREFEYQRITIPQRVEQDRRVQADQRA